MASIERTAYPRFKRALTRHELQTLYTPTADEQTFIEQQTQTDSLRLSMLVLLKTFQHLGYFPRLDKVPAAVVDQVRRALLCRLPVPSPRTNMAICVSELPRSFTLKRFFAIADFASLSRTTTIFPAMTTSCDGRSRGLCMHRFG